MQMSDTSRRRSGAGSERQTARMSPGGGAVGRSSRMRRTTARVTRASVTEAMRPARTPARTPAAAISARPAPEPADRQPAQNRLEREPDRPTPCRQGVNYHGEERRARHARPAHDEQEAHEQTGQADAPAMTP